MVLQCCVAKPFRLLTKKRNRFFYFFTSTKYLKSITSWIVNKILGKSKGINTMEEFRPWRDFLKKGDIKSNILTNKGAVFIDKVCPLLECCLNRRGMFKIFKRKAGNKSHNMLEFFDIFTRLDQLTIALYYLKVFVADNNTYLYDFIFENIESCCFKIKCNIAFFQKFEHRKIDSKLLSIC